MKYLITVIFMIACYGCGDGPVISPQPVVTIEIVSHRGIDAPDNTIDGFINAINQGFDSMETDLRMQGDVVVLAHDKTVEGRSYDTLESLLVLVGNSGVKIWIESKEFAVIVPTIELLREYDINNYVFASFSQSHLDKFRAIEPKAETGLIIQYADKINKADADWLIVSKNLLPINTDKKIAVWTIKEQREFNQVAPYVDAVISDVYFINSLTK